MLIAYWLIFMFTCSFFYCDFKSPISEEMAKQGRGKRQRGNDYLYLMEDHQKKNEKEQSEANKDNERKIDGKESSDELFEKAMGKACPLEVLSEYTWFMNHLPKLVDKEEENIVQMVQRHLKIDQMKKAVGHFSDENFNRDPDDPFPLLDSLSCVLGISLRFIAAPPTKTCLLCCRDLRMSSNKPSHATLSLHTGSGPQLLTKYVYECRSCSGIYSFNKKYELHNRLYFHLDRYGNPT